MTKNKALFQIVTRYAKYKHFNEHNAAAIPRVVAVYKTAAVDCSKDITDPIPKDIIS